MSVIGGPLRLADPLRLATDASDETMLASTAQGLVTFDAQGRITPGLAERWIITSDGLSIIFRIRRAQWGDNTLATGRQVAEHLRAITGPGSKHPMAPLFANVSAIIAMTGQVVEMRLRVPQPELLQLLAHPDMAIFHLRASQGTGPFRVHSIRAGVTRLRPVPDQNLEEPEDRGQRDDIRLRGESAAIAVARFQAREISLVTGGTFSDLALARAARPATSQFQIDPVFGLFGLAVSRGSKPLADASVRRAIAMAIDRDRIVLGFGVNSWVTAYSVLPAQLDSSARPAALEWVQLPFPDRIARAKALLNGKNLPTVRVALPAGTGGRLLFAELAADWRKIGIQAVQVGLASPADMRLIDEVAPQSAAFWYLHRLSCARGLPCDPVIEAGINAVKTAKSATERSEAIAGVDARLAEEQLFIPIALPLRWSLVNTNLTAWRPNAFAAHPLGKLRRN